MSASPPSPSEKGHRRGSRSASVPVSPAMPSRAASPRRTATIVTPPISPLAGRRRRKRSADDADTDDQSEVARSEASTSAAWESSLQQQHRGSKRAQLLQKAVQMQRKDPFCLTADKLKAKMAEDDSSPAHNLRSHASRSPLPAARSLSSAVRSPQRESSQMKMVSFSVQTRAPGARRPCTTPESYINQAVDNGDGADLLRVSCALGFLLSAGSAEVEPHEAMSYIDDAVLAATRSFRCIASDLVADIEGVLAGGEERAEALLSLVLVHGLENMQTARRFQRGAAHTSFLYHEVAAHEGPAMDSFARACFCLCMWSFLRETLGEQKKPTLHVCSADRQDEYWLAIRYSPRGAWRYFRTIEKPLCVREHSIDALPPRQPLPYSPLRLIGALLQRFWATALSSSNAVKRNSAFRSTSVGFCSKWLSLILELDREKGLGLAQSSVFVSSVRHGLEQGRIANSCLPELQALIARHAAERPEMPVSPLHGNNSDGAVDEGDRELWAAYTALGTIVKMSGGAGGGPGSGGGRIPTESIVCAAEQVGQASDVVMSRASTALRQRRAPGLPAATST